MIKIDTTESDFGFELDVHIEGMGEQIVKQLACALNEIAKKDEHLVAAALDLYLDLRGFPEVGHDTTEG